MTKKETKEVERKSRILEYLASEHVWENYLLLVLSLFALILGVLILNNTLTVNDSFPLIGDFPTLFAWFLVGAASLALILSLYPFFKPTWPEFKKITWPNKRLFGGNSIRVYMFLIMLTLLFLLYDAFISKLIGMILK